MRVFGRIAWRVAAVVAASGLAIGAANAGPIQISVTTAAGDGYDASAQGTLSNGIYTASDYGLSYGGTFDCDWSVSYDLDPFFSSTMTITNLSAVTQVFTPTVTLTVTPALAAPTRMGGFFGDVTATDRNANGSLRIATVGSTPFYVMRIDGNFMAGLGDFEYDDAGSDPLVRTITRETFGAPIPSAAGPAVNANLSGIVNFELSPGDRARIPIYFEVVVPEPSSALLVGLGIAGLVAIRRRRTS